MTLREVRRGLYERTDTPKVVKISREFAEAVKRNSKSRVLGEFMDQALREQERRETKSKD